ncbi:MAG: hypothetical protein AB2L09_09720 [Coriobacteriia bacterium]
MSEDIAHDEHVALQRATASAIARRVLNGTLSALEGACAVAHITDLEIDDVVGSSLFANIEVARDQAEALALDMDRTSWGSVARAAYARELERSESWARTFLKPAFEWLAVLESN